MTTQREITAGGDVAAGNIDKRQTFIIEAPKTQLGGLVEQLREQIGKDPEAAEFVESLLSWINPKKTALTRDLAEKLNACGKGHLICDALEAKERFAKQLKKTTFNPAIQEIYAYILGEIYANFNHRIKPRIAAAVEPGSIEGAIADLANTITSQIANAPTSLGVGMTEITGMLYYLTGNCHIDWDYNASIPSSD
ncbi:MAG: hypothetical protein KJ900_05065 [Proteobacteria bacterium]|nr:hypothetical protein [Desulfocapsa sp.]MBU3943669.1 hypothetical protein [Pseudomonadota bacterium]MCG2742336.1 hypothetical protein [Desulfobacteraceae bacterium]MBU4029917.1 hypothetical protein [Pseudomonadota bacterium]MBU4042251.1 hypothetical protein [Pseudomonadota bacterium]